MQNKPNEKNVREFTGWEVLCFDGALAFDAETCVHVIDDANGQNSMAVQMQMNEKVARAVEPFVYTASPLWCVCCVPLMVVRPPRLAQV